MKLTLKYTVKHLITDKDKRIQCYWYVFGWLYVVSIALCASQHAFCAQPYSTVEAVAIALIMVNSLYTFFFTIQKYSTHLISYKAENFDILKPTIMLCVLVAAIAVTAGKTPNCRNPTIRVLWRLNMSVITFLISIIQRENMEAKASIFEYILFDPEVPDDLKNVELPQALTQSLNQHADVETRFQSKRKILEKLRPLIQATLVLDLFCLTGFYILVSADRNGFIDGFSLTMTLIVMFLINMSSNIFNMVEYNKNIKYVSLITRRLVRLEVEILEWKPEGDILMGYLFGLAYLGIEVLIHEHKY